MNTGSPYTEAQRRRSRERIGRDENRRVFGNARIVHRGGESGRYSSTTKARILLCVADLFAYPIWMRGVVAAEESQSAAGRKRTRICSVFFASFWICVEQAPLLALVLASCCQPRPSARRSKAHEPDGIPAAESSLACSSTRAAGNRLKRQSQRSALLRNGTRDTNALGGRDADRRVGSRPLIAGRATSVGDP